jgi:hypothetical protein
MNFIGIVILVAGVLDTDRIQGHPVAGFMANGSQLSVARFQAPFVLFDQLEIASCAPHVLSAARVSRMTPSDGIATWLGPLITAS